MMASSIYNANVDETTCLLEGSANKEMDSITKRVNMCYGLRNITDDEEDEDHYIDADDSADDKNFMRNNDHRTGVLDYFENQDDIDTEYGIDNSGEDVNFSKTHFAEIINKVTLQHARKSAGGGGDTVDDIRQNIRDELTDSFQQKKIEEDISAQRARFSLRTETAHNVKVRLNNDHRSDEQYSAYSDDEMDSKLKSVNNSDEEEMSVNLMSGGIDGLENVVVNKRLYNDDSGYLVSSICNYDKNKMQWISGNLQVKEGWYPKEIIPIPQIEDEQDTFSALNTNTNRDSNLGRINTTSSNLRISTIEDSKDDTIDSSCNDEEIPVTRISFKINNAVRSANTTLLTTSNSKNLRMKEKNSCNDSAILKDREKYAMKTPHIIEKAPVMMRETSLRNQISLPIPAVEPIQVNPVKQIFIRDEPNAEDILMRKKKRREQKNKTQNKNIVKQYIIPGDDKNDEELIVITKKQMKKSKKNKLRELKKQNDLNKDKDTVSESSLKTTSENDTLNDEASKIMQIVKGNIKGNIIKCKYKIPVIDEINKVSLQNSNKDDEIKKDILWNRKNDARSKDVKDTKEQNKNKNLKTKDHIIKELNTSEQKNKENLNREIKDNLTKDNTIKDVKIKDVKSKDVKTKDIKTKESKASTEVIQNSTVKKELSNKKEIIKKDQIKKEINCTKVANKSKDTNRINKKDVNPNSDKESQFIDELNIEEITRKFAAMEAVPEGKFEKVKKKKNTRKSVNVTQQSPTTNKTAYTKTNDRYTRYDYTAKIDSPNQFNNHSNEYNKKEIVKEIVTPQEKSLPTPKVKAIEPFTESSFPALPQGNVPQDNIANVPRPYMKCNENKNENYLTKSRSYFFKKKNSLEKTNKKLNKSVVYSINQKQIYNKSNNQSNDESEDRVFFDNLNSTGIYSKSNRSDLKFGTSQPVSTRKTKDLESSLYEQRCENLTEHIDFIPPPVKYQYNINEDINMIAGHFDLKSTVAYMYNEWMTFSKMMLQDSPEVKQYRIQ